MYLLVYLGETVEQNYIIHSNDSQIDYFQLGLGEVWMRYNQLSPEDVVFFNDIAELII